MHGKETYPSNSFPLQVPVLPHLKIAKIAIMLGMSEKERGWENISCFLLATEGGESGLEVVDDKKAKRQTTFWDFLKEEKDTWESSLD